MAAAAVPNGVLTAEELIVLLWAFKELTPLGLGPYRGLVAAALPRVQAKDTLEGWSLLRLVQTSEVLLASRHALGTLDKELVVKVAHALERAVGGEAARESGGRGGQCSPEMLARIVALWDQAGDEFWSRASGLAEAVVGRALTHVEDPALPAAVLHPMLDTLWNSSFARTNAFAIGRGALRGAAAARKDADNPGLAAAVKNLSPESAPAGSANAESGDAEQRDSGTVAGVPSEMAAQSFAARPPLVLPPVQLVERLVSHCQKGAPNAEVEIVAEALLMALDQLDPNQAVEALDRVLTSGQRRLLRTPVLVDVAERLGDVIVAHVSELSTLQLTGALTCFASVGLPYHLVYETVLCAVIERHQAQGLSWGQVIGVLECFANVRLKIPELRTLYQHLRQPHELARLPTMALVRFLSAASRLELVDEDHADTREVVERVLAETTPAKPLPLDSSVMIVQSLVLSGTVLPDRPLRHLLAWVALARAHEITPEQLMVLRQYCVFLLTQPDAHDRGSLFRLPVEVQRFATGVMRHRSPAWMPGNSDTTRRFRGEVTDLALKFHGGSAVDGQISEAQSATRSASLPLGPVGSVDLHVGGRCWLLDGPEAFFRPFIAISGSSGSGLRYTPQEKRRAWLLERVLSDNDSRRFVADFFPPAALWPLAAGPQRLSWLAWAHTAPSERLQLLGLPD
eukprot:TRINITY_DN75084_c0_g1_i1.p1 TRINITY_DN75084_c0_g1~~TRINITY_DN75084_c0_g1_i1.p1  ORF type:complete len:714 (+),score=118.49 TRINITY_DN75084_c0_g1_i1:89-2143(+)